MKNTKTNKKRARLYVILGIIVLLALIIGVSVYALSRSPSKKTTPADQPTTSTVNTSAPTNDQVQAGTTIKQQSIENSDAADNSTTSTTGSLSVTLTPPTYDQANSILHVRVQIAESASGNTVGSGTCSLTLTQGATTKTFPTVAIQANSTYSTCAGFDIPYSEINATGTWTVTVNATSSSGESGQTTGTVAID